LIRYQFGNQLGSAIVELDQSANIISYEEYYPYGSTSYESVDKSIKAAATRYRYTGKERDEETGFNYHGARYYAPWLGRWASCDKGRSAGAKSLYISARDNPINWVDPSGNDDVGALAMAHSPKALAERDKGMEEAFEHLYGAARATFDFGVGSFVFTHRVFSDPERAMSDVVEGVRSIPGAVKDTVKNWDKTSEDEKAYRVVTAVLVVYSTGRAVKGIARVAGSLRSGEGGAVGGGGREGGGGGEEGGGETPIPPPVPRFSQISDVFSWAGRNLAVVRDAVKGTTQLWYQSSGTNGVRDTWYPTQGIIKLPEGKWRIAKGLELPGGEDVLDALMEARKELEDAKRRGATETATRKERMIGELDEALRRGGREHEAAFDWANSGGIQGDPVPSTPEDINATAVRAGAPPPPTLRDR
jgi:RHS repeat-associated protein